MRSAGEATRLAASAGGVVTADLGLAARYYQQGHYVQAELTYSQARVRPEVLIPRDIPPAIPPTDSTSSSVLFAIRVGFRATH